MAPGSRREAQRGGRARLRRPWCRSQEMPKGDGAIMVFLPGAHTLRAIMAFLHGGFHNHVLLTTLVVASGCNLVVLCILRGKSCWVFVRSQRRRGVCAFVSARPFLIVFSRYLLGMCVGTPQDPIDLPHMSFAPGWGDISKLFIRLCPHLCRVW